MSYTNHLLKYPNESVAKKSPSYEMTQKNTQNSVMFQLFDHSSLGMEKNAIKFFEEDAISKESLKSVTIPFSSIRRDSLGFVESVIDSDSLSERSYIHFEIKYTDALVGIYHMNYAISIIHLLKYFKDVKGVWISVYHEPGYYAPQTTFIKTLEDRLNEAMNSLHGKDFINDEYKVNIVYSYTNVY